MKNCSLIMAIAVVWGSFTAQAQTTNLLINAGAESGDLTGWMQGGSSTPGVDNGTFDRGINPHTGGFDFYGHNGSYGSLSQRVALTGQPGVTPEALDAGKLAANISFWETGLGQSTPSDDAQVTLIFLDAVANTIATVTSGEVDSHEGTWSNYTSSFLIPAGTRSIVYTMEFIRHAGSDCDSFIDDNELTISPARPVLQIAVVNANAVLSWPQAFSGFILESAGSPSAANWTPVPDAVHQVGNQNTVTNALAPDRQFFRLRGT